MAKETPLMARSIFNSLRLSLIPLVVLLAVVAGSVNPRPEPARANPTAVLALNHSLCVALGSAFGGIPTTTAATNCLGFDLQANMQSYVHCLRGFDANNDGTHDCLTGGDIIQVEPEFFAALDRDANQFHPGQGSHVMLFVEDDFPVRFVTDVGNWRGLDKDIECGRIVDGADFYDEDCDQDPATAGDGVVVYQLNISQSDVDAAEGGTGTAHVTVVQEGIGFPIELTYVGAPQNLTVVPLFGAEKAVQTGSTLATPAGQYPFSTDCNFGATSAAVLGANNSAEQAVVVVKAQDDHGNDVVGALISWDLTKFFPPPEATSAPTGTFALNRLAQGGVALPQTPTLDTGLIGYSFPQFICGGKVPGDLNLTASMFTEVLDPFADHKVHVDITIKVIGPATELALTAEPATIDCNGTNTSSITANLVNAAGDPVAKGLDVHFEVATLGTVSPLLADTTDGKASTVLTPLSGANNATADGQPRGVTVRAWATGALLSPGSREPVLRDPGADPDDPDAVYVIETIPPEHAVIENSIFVACSGGPPPPAEQVARNAEAARGAIRPPDTGSGGSGAADAPWWSLVALAMGGAALAASRLALAKDRQ